MALDTLYQLTFKQLYQNQLIENVFFYDHIAGDGVAQDLANDWISVVMPLIQALEVNSMSIFETAVINLGDLADFWTEAQTVTGLYGATDPLPSFNALGYTLKLDTRAVAKGSKRICGVPEEVTTKNAVTSSGYLASMELLRLQLQANIVVSPNTWQPVVIKRVKTAVTGTVPLRYTYRLPTIGETPVVGHVVTALTSPFLTSQVSRKE